MNAAHPSFGILTVCTGNVCRSPLAALLLTSRFADLAAQSESWGAWSNVRATSAGHSALVGQPMTPEMALQARELGLQPADHIARQLSVGDIGGAGLVLALSRAHRRYVVSAVPGSSRITFALPEFARLIDDLASDPTSAREGADGWGRRLRLPFDPIEGPGAVLPRVVAAAAERRGFVAPPEDPAVDDVVDPFRQSSTVYARSVRQVTDAVDVIVGAVLRLAAA